jgi:hypothetical protein
VFENVQAKLRSNNLREGRGNSRRRTADWPLAGLLECADCHGPMYGLTVPVGRKKDGTERRAERRMYGCSTYQERGRGTCYYNAALESEMMKLIFLGLQKRLSDPATLAELERECKSFGRGRRKDLAAEAAALRDKAAELERDYRQGLANLARVAPQLVKDVEGQVLRWKDEREQVLDELRKVEAAAAKAAEDDQLVSRAMELFQVLSKKARKAEGLPQVREALGPLVERVEVRFDHQPLGNGKRTRSTLSSVTVHFRDIGALLPPVSIRSSGASACARPCP